MVLETITFILEEMTTTPDGTTTTRHMEVQCTPEQVALLMGRQSPMLPEPKSKIRTWDDTLPEILWQQERIRQRQEKRARQAQKAICAPSRGLLQDFYEMLG